MPTKRASGAAPGNKKAADKKAADKKATDKRAADKRPAKNSAARSGGRLFEVRRSSVHGRGGFALQTITRGTRVVEYTGEKINWKEVWRRYPDDDAEGEQNHTFLFEIDDKYVRDANHGGNSSRWINHSCNPNCIVVGEDDRIFIEARRTIKPGEELNYDYNIQLEERHTPAVKRRYLCRCGARGCRGTLLGKKR
jgi:SET domain-containing protein